MVGNPDFSEFKVKDSLELPPAEEDGYLPTIPEHLFTLEDNFTTSQSIYLSQPCKYIAGVGQENPTQRNFATAQSRGQIGVMCTFER